MSVAAHKEEKSPATPAPAPEDRAVLARPPDPVLCATRNAAGCDLPRWFVTSPEYGYVTIYDREQKGYVWSRHGQRSTKEKREREAGSICAALNEGRLSPLPIQTCPLCNVTGWLDFPPAGGTRHHCRACSQYFDKPLPA